VVLHLAAQPGVPQSVGRPVLDAEINVLGTLNVLEGARLGRTRKVVVASSGGTLYGEVAPRHLPAKESQRQAPLSPHGVSTRVALEYLRLYRHLHDLEYTALALANVYGPRQDPERGGGVVAAFAAQLLADEPCTIHGDGEQTRDFVYVDDCVDALVRAIERGDGLVINVGTGVQTSINALYAAMAEAAGVDRPARGAAVRPGDLQRSALDATRARIQLGWTPWTDLSEGTDRVLDWFRAGCP
jgi:UDP-glucose 4-epimerase